MTQMRVQRRVSKAATGSTIIDLIVITISGFMMWAAFPGLSWWPLAFPSLAILIGVVDQVRPARAAAYSALWTMVFMMPMISWMQIATDNTWLAWFALAGAQAFFVSLWGLSFAALRVWSWARTIWGEAFGAALLWVAVEELRSRVPFGGFPWGKLAYPQVDSPLVVFAPIGGEVLVAFIVVVISMLLRRGLAFGRGNAQNTGVFARVVATAAAVLLLFAPWVTRLPNNQQNGTLDVAVIQGNIEIPMNETFATPRKVTGNHVRQTEAMLSSGFEPDLIFWGENSTDIDPRKDPETAQMVGDVVRTAGVPTLIGVMEYKEDERFNWVGFWDPETGLSADLYGKQHPVPWGEYVPFRDLTESLATAAAQISIDMSPVDNPGFLEATLNDGRVLPIAVGICFEVAYEPIIAEGVRLGGELIVIPTNNAHFQNSDESVQQLQMAQFRAAQFSRSAMQVSTNGVSALIRPDGSVQAATGTQEAAFLVGSLPLRNSITPSAKMGEWPSWIVMALGLGLSTMSLGAYFHDRSLTRRQQRPQNQRGK